MPRILQPDATVLDRFTIVEQVTAGGQSIGYHGKDQEAPPDEPWHRNVFVKQYHDLIAGSEEAMGLPQHFEVLRKRLSENENLVCLPRGVGEEANSVIAVYPWVEGETLRDRMEEGLEEADYLRTVFGLTKAVRVLHEKGVAHLDLKPSNIVAQRGRGEKLFIRIIDFDTAQIDGEGLRKATMVTPLYSSPEHYFPEEYGLVSTKSDIFTLGILLFELLFKQHPFNETYDYPQAIENEVFSVPASNYHREVVEEIMACLSARPSDRPTAGQLLYMLNQHYDTDLKAESPEDRFEPSGDQYYVQLSSQKKTNFRRTYYESIGLDWNELRGSDVTRFEGVLLRLVPDGNGCWLGVASNTLPVALQGEVLEEGNWMRLNSEQMLKIGDAEFNLAVKEVSPSSGKSEEEYGLDEADGKVGEQQVKEGSTYVGKVKNIVDYGAFIEIKPGVVGLLHISEICQENVEDVKKYLNIGDDVQVKLLNVERNKEEYSLTHKPFSNVYESNESDGETYVQSRIVVDGSSLCYDSDIFISLDILLNFLLEIRGGFDVWPYFDSRTRGKMEEEEDEVLLKLHRKIPNFCIVWSTKADPFVLQRADEIGARVVTNDKYDEYRDEYPWIEEQPERLVRHQLVGNKLEIPKMYSGDNFSVSVRNDTKAMADELIRHLGH